jgi:hypothetical protein
MRIAGWIYRIRSSIQLRSNRIISIHSIDAPGSIHDRKMTTTSSNLRRNRAIGATAAAG